MTRIIKQIDLTSEDVEKLRKIAARNDRTIAKTMQMIVRKAIEND